MNTAAYYYVLDDRNGQEIVSYQWHPESRSPIRFPHLHVGPAAGCEREEFATAHCPTGLRTDWSDLLA